MRLSRTPTPIRRRSVPRVILALATAGLLLSSRGSAEAPGPAPKPELQILAPAGKLPGVMVYEPLARKKAGKAKSVSVAPRLTRMSREKRMTPVPRHPEREAAVMLHGMCDEPTNECPAFAPTLTRRGWLVCPRARLACPGGGPIWSWKKRDETVELAFDRAKAMHPGEMRDDARLLLGFSLGGFAAIDLLHRGSKDYDRVVVLGARVYPNARLLKKAGVKRIILAAGRRDMVFWHMKEQARQLRKRGIDARFSSLGKKVGHWFPRDFDRWLSRELVWLDGGPVPPPEPKARPRVVRR